MQSQPSIRTAASHWDRPASGNSRWVIIGVLSMAFAVYVGGIFWFGQGLAEDVRAGVREVRSGVVIPDMER